VAVFWAAAITVERRSLASAAAALLRVVLAGLGILVASWSDLVWFVVFGILRDLVDQ
jgi:hypothetical protein